MPCKKKTKYQFPMDQRKRCTLTSKSIVHHEESPNRLLSGQFPQCCRLYSDLWYEGGELWTFENGKFVHLKNNIFS